MSEKCRSISVWSGSTLFAFPPAHFGYTICRKIDLFRFYNVVISVVRVFTVTVCKILSRVL